MGQPCSKIRKSPEKKPNYIIRPSSKQTLVQSKEEMNFKGEKLEFNVSLEHIKAKNLSHSDIHIYFNFADYFRTFTIYASSNSENPHFKFNEDFDYKCTRNMLKNTSAILTIRDSNKKDLVSIKLNLYELATGPFHHDMILQNKSANFKGRILFDLKMKQMITFFVRPIYAHVTLEDPLKEKAYNINLRIITSDGEINSEHSDNIFNQFYMGKGDKATMEDNQPEENENYEITMNEIVDYQSHKTTFSRFIHTNSNEKNAKKIEKDRSHMILKKNISKQSVQSPIDSPRLSKNISITSQGIRSKLNKPILNEKYKKELIWNYKDHKKDPINLEADVLANEFSSNSLQFCLWGTNNPEEFSNNYSEEENCSKKDDDNEAIRQNRSLVIHFVDLRLIGECYWSFNKIFREDFHAYETNENEQYIISKTEKLFKEKLWNHGALVGEIEAHFYIELTPFLRQMIGGVRTETGVKEATNLVSQNHKILENLNYSSKLKAFVSSKDSMIMSVLRLLDKSKISKSSVKEKFQTEAVNNIKKLKELIVHDSSFVYKNEEELFQSQNILIELAEHLLNYADEMDEKIRELYYDLLTIACNREELNLHSVGFDQSTYDYLLNLGTKMIFQKGESKTKNEIKFLALKMKVGLTYQGFLYTTLIKVLDKFTQKAINVNEKHFIENFVALAYFRIPEFRIQFLDSFIEQTKDQEQLFEIWNEPKQKPIGLAVYDWEKNFHKFLKTSPKGVKHLQEFQIKLDGMEWKQGITKKDPLFFSLLGEWCRSVYFQKVYKYHIPWNEIPGYPVLVNALMFELKNKSVVHYHRNLKEATKFMLLNEKLLSIFVMTVYKNTRVFDSVATFNTFELIDTWLEFLQIQKKPISTIFDYSFFFKGIKMAIEEQDHALCIAKCVNMIYNNYQLFPTVFKKELCDYLFSGMFFKLFMHWNISVRIVFHHFLIYRIHHLHRNMKTQMTDIGDLYKELMKPHDYQSKNHIINDVIFVWYSKMIKNVEDAKERLEIEEENINYDTNPFESLRRKLNKENTTNNINYQKKFSHNSFNVGKKKSFILENSFLESERDTIKSVLIKDHEEMIHNNMFQSLGNLHNAGIEKNEKDELSLREINNDTELNASKTNVFTFTETSPLKEFLKKGKIYINRRNIYFDKEEEKYLKIPEEYLKYLLQAFKEFEKLKKKYWGWFINQKAKLSQLPEEELKKAIHAMKVPQVNIRILFDEMERSEEEINEW